MSAPPPGPSSSTDSDEPPIPRNLSVACAWPPHIRHGTVWIDVAVSVVMIAQALQGAAGVVLADGFGRGVWIGPAFQPGHAGAVSRGRCV